MNVQPRSNVVTIKQARNHCGNCRVASLCVASGLPTHDIDKLVGVVQHPQPVKRGDFLGRAGDEFRSVYIVKGGSFKSTTIDEGGNERVTGFHLPGDPIGFDAIGSGVYPGDITALETSSVCKIPFQNLERLCSATPGLQRSLLRSMSREILRDEQHLLLMAKKSSEGRLAAFLLSLSDKFQARGYSGTEFHLSMSRVDIGNYLGLAMETVSRLFSRLQDLGLISVDKRRIRLLDHDALKVLIDGRDALPLKRVGT